MTGSLTVTSGTAASSESAASWAGILPVPPALQDLLVPSAMVVLLVVGIEKPSSRSLLSQA